MKVKFTEFYYRFYNFSLSELVAKTVHYLFLNVLNTQFRSVLCLGTVAKLLWISCSIVDEVGCLGVPPCPDLLPS